MLSHWSTDTNTTEIEIESCAKLRLSLMDVSFELKTINLKIYLEWTTAENTIAYAHKTIYHEIEIEVRSWRV